MLSYAAGQFARVGIDLWLTAWASSTGAAAAAASGQPGAASVAPMGTAGRVAVAFGLVSPLMAIL